MNIDDMIIVKRSCHKCGYEWWPRTKATKRCPNPKCQTWLYENEKEEENTAERAERSLV